MNRVRTQALAEHIGIALQVLPEPWRGRPPCDFFEGDPIFAGLYPEDDDGPDARMTELGRTYRNTAHVCYEEHLTGPRDRKRVTVVLQPDNDWDVVLHELGHVFDRHFADRTGEELDFPPVWNPEGGGRDRMWYLDWRQERVAEAFCSWYHPPNRHDGDWYYVYRPEVWERFDRIFAVGGKGF